MLKKVNWKNYRELSGAATDAAITRTLLHSQLLYAFTVDLCYHHHRFISHEAAQYNNTNEH